MIRRVRARFDRARQAMDCAWFGHRERFVSIERRGNHVSTIRTCTRCLHDRNRDFVVGTSANLPTNVVALGRVG